jgi:hypothetical protein
VLGVAFLAWGLVKAVKMRRRMGGWRHSAPLLPSVLSD